MCDRSRYEIRRDDAYQKFFINLIVANAGWAATGGFIVAAMTIHIAILLAANLFGFMSFLINKTAFDAYHRYEEAKDQIRKIDQKGERGG